MTVYIEGIGRITASKAALNTLSLLASKAGEHYTKEEYFALAREATDIGYAMYKALKETGYYEKQKRKVSA